MSNCLVLADPNRCIGCYTCMATCAKSHEQVGLQAYPRLTVTQTPVGTMPIQCRHCEDAPCAKVCPVHAIQMVDQSVRVNEGLCIGCKLCALVCPFGAITPTGTKPPSVVDSIPEIFSYNDEPQWPAPLYGEQGRIGVPPTLAWRVGQKTVAVKCDQCYFRENGPACIEVCPTKALRMVDSQALETLVKSRRSQAVSGLTAESNP